MSLISGGRCRLARILRSARLRRAALVRDMGLYPFLDRARGWQPVDGLRSASPSLICLDAC